MIQEFGRDILNGVELRYNRAGGVEVLGTHLVSTLGNNTIGLVVKVARDKKKKRPCHKTREITAHKT
jgi:hypothetical protein